MSQASTLANDQVWCVRCAYTTAATQERCCPRCGGDLRRNDKGQSTPACKPTFRQRKAVARLIDQIIEDDLDPTDLNANPAKSCRSCIHWASLDEVKVGLGFALCSIIDMPSPAAYCCEHWTAISEHPTGAAARADPSRPALARAADCVGTCDSTRTQVNDVEVLAADSRKVRSCLAVAPIGGVIHNGGTYPPK